uniref:Uncharacterized protein n=1 Tax=Magallana gigas TaxID=29159 RepID=A0A8W8LXR4_MAGGI
MFCLKESVLLLLAIVFKYTTGLRNHSSDHGFPLQSSSLTRSPTRATYPTTTCTCPSPIPCPSPTVCPVTKCPTVTRYPVITPCPSPKPCPAVTANPSTSVCRCPAIPLAGIKAQNIILSLEDQAVSPGSFIGAALGGAVLGSSFTVIAFVCIRRRCKTRHNSRKDNQMSKNVKNTIIQYSKGNKHLKMKCNESAVINSNSAYSEIQDELREPAKTLPIRQEEDVSNKEDVYNHLHASDKEDRSDYYDHAGPAPSLSVMEGGYGVLLAVTKGSCELDYKTMDGETCTDIRGSMITDNTKNNKYFIIEPQKDQRF